MKNQFIQKKFICFIFYAILGWGCEVLYYTFHLDLPFKNRGMLLGPYMPIYGLYAIVCVIALGSFMKKKGGFLFKLLKILIVYLLCTIIISAVQLGATYVLEHFTGSWSWAAMYQQFDLNFENRVALIPSLKFGVAGLIILYIFQPLIDIILDKQESQSINVVFAIAFTILACDCFFTFALPNLHNWG